MVTKKNPDAATQRATPARAKKIILLNYSTADPHRNIKDRSSHAQEKGDSLDKNYALVLGIGTIPEHQ